MALGLKRTIVTVTDDSTRADLELCIGYLRDKQRRSVIPSTAQEYADEVDRLLDEWAARPA